MAILTLIAITLLSVSSVRTLEIPSTKEAIQDLQKRLSPIKGNILATVQENVVPMSASIQRLTKPSQRYNPMAYSSSVGPKQVNVGACMNASMVPCIAGLGVIDDAMMADNATSAGTILDGYCTNCTNATAAVENVIEACGITSESEQMNMLMLATVIDNACGDTACAGVALWSLYDLDERSDTFCTELDCGLPIIAPFLEQAASPNATGENCITNMFSLLCLRDSENATLACTDFVDEELENDRVQELCESSCAQDLTIVFEELLTEECGMEPFFECDNEDVEPFRLYDYCTVNEDGGYCFELMNSDDTNLTACGDIFNLVPAPGSDEIMAPDTCPSECAAGLEAFVETVGCCAGFALEFTCADSVLTDYISDTCEVEYETCARPVMPSEVEEPANDASSVCVTFATVAAIAVASVLL